MNKSRAFCALLLLITTARAVPPANDNFANRINLGSNDFGISANNTEATLEAGEPTFGSVAASSIWYEWTAPTTGVVSLTATGSGLDGIIGVFTGSNVGSLTQIGFNDDSFDPADTIGTFSSRLGFKAVAGTSYKFSLSGYSGAQGTCTLQLSYLLPTAAFAVSSISLTPDPANITNAAASMTLNVSAGTTLSGPVAMTVHLQSASDLQRVFNLTLGDSHRISGDATNGSYQLAFTLPRYISPGDWKATITATDGSRDTAWSFGGDDIGDDFALPLTADPVLAVTNTGQIDSIAPTLTALTATPTSINAGTIAESGRVITLSISLTDNLAGISFGSIILVSSTNIEQTVATFNLNELTTGTALNGDYEVTAIVPYGLTVGDYAVRVRLQDGALVPATFSNVVGSGDSSLPALADDRITITGTTGYPEWAAVQSFPSGHFEPTADADADSASNLLEYAFGMNPAAADAIAFLPPIATSGLPLITLQSGHLHIEFLRRKASTNSGLTYEAQFSDTLLETGPGAWTTFTSSTTVFSIDETWERVIIDDIALAAPKRFGRVKLTYLQP